ncbi:ABC transporter permease [Bauldia sp.]|uniref:ABC transporter permease n=1 Tax=Bauldia sp. TaxID=2575872 RepID=UPI003BADA848
MNNSSRLFEKPWIWAFVAAIAVWLATIIFTQGQGAGDVLTAAFSFATFSVIVALGQMMVITLGPGNVDLSIPATMTLAGTVATKIMATQDSMIVVGLAAALVVGLGVGVFNYGLIRLLRIPPIIATLSSSFLFQSAAIWYNRGLRVKPPPALADFSTETVLGIPVLAVFIIALSVAVHIVLHRTLYGRAVTAIGQNMRAAALAGINVNRTRFITYVYCAVLAAVNGFFFSAFSGGAALNMGQAYLLNSIAVVVIGGTSVAGGFANVPGLWGAALFLFLVEAMLNTYGLGAGIRLVLTGLIIVGVITAAGGQKTLR